MTVWRDGEVGSGSSGSSGGGSVGISREWQEAYSVDFSTLPDQDLKRWATVMFRLMIRFGT